MKKRFWTKIGISTIVMQQALTIQNNDMRALQLVILMFLTHETERKVIFKGEVTGDNTIVRSIQPFFDRELSRFLRLFLTSYSSTYHSSIFLKLRQTKKDQTFVGTLGFCNLSLPLAADSNSKIQKFKTARNNIRPFLFFQGPNLTGFL